MNGDAMKRSTHDEIEAGLRDSLSKGDAAFSSVAPVLGHMLDESWPSIVTESTLAHVRGMIFGLAGELGASAPQKASALGSSLEQFGRSLFADKAMLEHCFTLAVEGEVTERLASDHAMDRVLSPLLQELVGSQDQTVAELAMQCITAQSRFARAHARMQTQLNELPPDLFHSILSSWQEFATQHRLDLPIQAVETLRKQYDENATRIALLERLIGAVGPGARAALELRHAGFALFATALAKLSSQSRALAVLASQAPASPRLALSLRAAALDGTDIEAILALLGGETPHVSGMAQILPDQAQSILNDTVVP